MYANPTRRLTAVSILLIFGLASSALADRAIHVWTDENGVRYYADVAPADSDAEIITIESTPVQPADTVATASAGAEGDTETAAQRTRREIAEARSRRAEEAEDIEYLCSRHRTRLEQMEPARRVYYRDENGQEVRMDDARRVTLVEESRDFIAENCN